MATYATDKFIEQLRRVVLFGGGPGLTDASLLRRFAEERDAAAFEAIMRRHGPYGLGSLPPHPLKSQDAEDAFQATFLVLVRKAATLRPRDMVGNWLYGVAHQTAIRTRALNAKRSGREKQVTNMPHPHAARANSQGDLQDWLDQELSRLPEKYRAAIVLCDLEGKSRAEAARQLGWPEGTVSGRLARGRALLAKRLAKHGPATLVGALAAQLSPNSASACLPASLASSTIKAATTMAAGQTAATGLISAKVVAITEGVLKAMLLTKLKIATTVVTMALTCGGACLLGHSTTASSQNPAVPVASPKANDANSPAQDRSPKDKPKPAAKGDKMFPDGRDYDFGIVLRGNTFTHSFRVVNTTNASLTLKSVRASCGCLRASVSPAVLAPNEVGKVDIAIDANRFVGPKTVVLYLTVEGPEATEEYRFTISANSQSEIKT